MAVRPLRSATHRRLGVPLPLQPANAPQVHPCSHLCRSFNEYEMPPIHLSGFSYRFQQLSRAHGQVTYVLLTRSPLDSGKQAFLPLVRLACIRHAASVHPEPGSNSPFDFSSKRFLLTFLLFLCYLFHCLKLTFPV